MGRREILGLSRGYVLDVILCPRKSNGMPDWKEEPSANGKGFLYELCVKRGLPHDQALKAAARMAKEQRNGRSA